MTDRNLSVDCPHCQLRVLAPVRAYHTVHIGDEESYGYPDHRVSLCKCPQCDNPLVAREDCVDMDFDGPRWGKPVRVWPEPARASHASIPPIVQVSLDEADRCHRAGAHTACAVMCGRALEGICEHHGVNTTLAKGIPELRAQGLIDQRLAEWGDALRRVRNTAAHASEERISKEDATDLLHFVTAICDYIYVLTARFDAFKKRRLSSTSTDATEGAATVDANDAPEP
ncbi:MAG: DUF4145 domain-containing protein [Planctomycetes bacterium]|nr:DUF4145 domain-containing protein [Planctomycetota bacterium]